MSSGAFWSWYLLNIEKVNDISYLSLIPPLFTFMFILKWLMFRLSIEEKVNYIIKVEKIVGHFGWERYLHKDEGGNRIAKWHFYEWFFWIVLFALNSVVAIISFNSYCFVINIIGFSD